MKTEEIDWKIILPLFMLIFNFYSLFIFFFASYTMLSKAKANSSQSMSELPSDTSLNTFLAWHLSVIRFCRKIVTKCLYLLLTCCIFWYKLKYTCSTHCSISNKNNIVAGIMYKHVSCNVSFTIIASRILTSSISRSWIDSDEPTVDCTSCSISMRLSMIVVHVAWGSTIWFPRLSPRINSTKDVDPTLIPISKYL